jgi:hypothetical protein
VWASAGADAIAEFVKGACGSVRALVNLIALTHRVCAINNLATPTAEAVYKAADVMMAR